MLKGESIMRKKGMAIFMAMLLSVCCLTACDNGGTEASGGGSSTGTVSTSSVSDGSSTAEQSSTAVDTGDMFADGDYNDVTGENANAEITLSGSQGTISDTTRGSSGSTVTITSKGTYRITGSSEEVTIVVNDDQQSGNIYLILDNVTMKNSATACINVQAADKVIIQCVGNNSLTMTAGEADGKIDGAIYSKDDVTINGSGTLSVNSALHGIVCKADLKITGGTLNVNADSVGIQADNSVRIGGGKTTVISGHDGVKLADSKNSSFFCMQDGTLTIEAGYDGISVKADSGNSADFTGYTALNGGKLTITAGGGSDNSKNSSTSQKGIKCDGLISFAGTEVTVSSADDAVHGNAGITVDSGTLSLSSSDDGITASGDLTINGGTINVSKSYEGLEAYNITINSGDIRVYSSDDGFNCAGGSDTSSSGDDMPGRWSSAGSDAKLTINGGTVYVNANGDGLDSNGSIYVTGGTTIVEGPTGDGNGALDAGDGADCVASITGGTVLAIGSTGMAVNFDAGTQCSGLVSLSGASGTTITVDDGSGFSFEATKSFACVVYSSPGMTQGNSYTVTAGSSTASLDFSSGLYYSTVSGMGGGRRGGMG